jgi:hypothetical protein
MKKQRKQKLLPRHCHWCSKAIFHHCFCCFVEPILTLGYKPIFDPDENAEQYYPPGAQHFKYTTHDMTVLDLFDPRAQLRYDLNDPVPESEHEAYQTVVDLGTVEHIFDTRMCFENCFRMLATGGSYILCTPVKGRFRHGLHTFSPELIDGILRLNYFRIIWRGFLEPRNSSELSSRDVGIFLVAQKTRPIGKLVLPYWRPAHAE